MPSYSGIKRRKDQDGFEGFVRLKQADGRWITRRAYGRTAKEAHEHKDQILRDHRDGIVRSKELVTVGDMARHWLQHWRDTNPEREQNTDDDYSYAVDMLVTWMGDLRLDAPSRDLIKSMDKAFVGMLTRGRRKGVTPARDWTGRLHPARLWARENGLEVQHSGRLSPAVLDGWVKAGSPGELRPAPPLAETRPWHAIPDIEKQRYRLSNITVLGVRRKLSMICDQAVIDGYMRVNPVRHLKRIERKPLKEKVAFTVDQVLAVTDAIRTRPDEVQVRWALALTLALRQGEVLGLRWAKVDWSEMTVLIDTAVGRQNWQHGCDDPDSCDHRDPGRQHRAVARAGYADDRYTSGNRAARCPRRHSGGLVLKSTKEDDAETVPLTPQLVALLRAHRKSQNELRLLAGSRWQDNDLVFCTAAGGLIDPRRDWETWRDLLVEHGLPGDAGTHSAKHTAVTIALDAGVDELIVSKVLARHKSGVAFTRSQYQHMRGRKKAGDVLRETMGAAVFGVTGDS